MCCTDTTPRPTRETVSRPGATPHAQVEVTPRSAWSYPCKAGDSLQMPSPRLKDMQEVCPSAAVVASGSPQPDPLRPVSCDQLEADHDGWPHFETRTAAAERRPSPSPDARWNHSMAEPSDMPSRTRARRGEADFDERKFSPFTSGVSDRVARIQSIALSVRSTLKWYSGSRGVPMWATPSIRLGCSTTARPPGSRKTCRNRCGLASGRTDRRSSSTYRTPHPGKTPAVMEFFPTSAR